MSEIQRGYLEEERHPITDRIQGFIEDEKGN